MRRLRRSRLGSNVEAGLWPASRRESSRMGMADSDHRAPGPVDRSRLGPDPEAGRLEIRVNSDYSNSDYSIGVLITANPDRSRRASGFAPRALNAAQGPRSDPRDSRRTGACPCERPPACPCGRSGSTLITANPDRSRRASSPGGRERVPVNAPLVRPKPRLLSEPSNDREWPSLATRARRHHWQ